MPIRFPPDRTKPPASMLRPLPFASGRMRLRLLMLFGMLVMVLLAMQEAGKPENWRWMGFIEKPAIELNSENSNAVPDGPTADRQLGSPANRLLPADSNRPAADPAGPVPIRLGSTPVPLRPERLESAYPESAKQFWVELYSRLDETQRASLMTLTRMIRNSPTDRPQPDDQPAMQALLKHLRLQRDAFHQELFDRLTLLPDSAPEKRKLSGQFDESDRIWSQLVLPAFQSAAAGEQPTLAQQQAVIRLQGVLDELALASVEDRTSIGWRGDSEAWKRLWEKTRDPSQPPAEPVTRVQLMSQPAVYRGRRVAIEGWVRAARRQTLPADSSLNQSHDYTLWLRPQDSKLGPYCVTSLTLPDGFPEVTDQFGQYNQKVQLEGTFFKIRSYVAGNGQVEYCPVILTDRFTQIDDENPLATTHWQPGIPVIVGMLVVIPLFAGAVAWWVYRSSATRRMEFSSGQRSRIRTGLADLGNDPGVQTDLEKIQSIGE